MAHTVIALYRPKPDCEAALRELIRTHVPRLRELGLATDAPVTLLRSPETHDYLEIFDWRDQAAVDKAHDHPEVLKMWGAFGEVCEFVTMKDLAQANKMFPHFERVTD